MFRDIHIKARLNGFEVKIGCQKLVFESIDRLVEGLREYLKADDPDEFEREFMKSCINYLKIPGAEVGVAPAEDGEYSGTAASDEVETGHAAISADQAISTQRLVGIDLTLLESSVLVRLIDEATRILDNR